MQTSLIGEIHAVQGKLLTNPTENVRVTIDNYMKLIEQAEKEIAVNNEISETTKDSLNCNFNSN